MKYRRLAVLAFASAFAVVRAQQEEERHAPPIEIPDFSNLDEYIYEPKSAVKLSFRHLSGAKASFSGGGTIAAPEGTNPTTGTDVNRVYHDGLVLVDQRTVARVDSAGNPMIDPQTGAQIFDRIAPDGKTNSWSYTDTRQLTGSDVPNGYIAFHTYSSEIIDTTTRNKDSRASNGLDLSVSRDMNNLFKTRFTWNLVAGLSVNDISANMRDYVLAKQTENSHAYSTYGQTIPDPPYSSPSSSTQNGIDANGGVSTTGAATLDTSITISAVPDGYSSKTTTSTTTNVNNWRIRGAFYTFRAGAEIWFPITTHLKAGMSFGPALIYSGTSYTVVETQTPGIGTDIIEAGTDSVNRILPALYADASLQYDVTEKTGFFAGAIYQTAGSYTQTLNTSSMHYKAKVDFSSLNGIRAGMSIRF